MPGLNKNRKRPVTIAFRVTAQEAQRINQRVKISGLSRRKYGTTSRKRTYKIDKF